MDSIYLGRAEANMLGGVHRGNIAAVKEYLDKGGNVNLQDKPSMTPLHHAVNSDMQWRNLKMVKLLIDRRANVNAIDDTHYTPLHMANNKETAELLIDAGAVLMPRHNVREIHYCSRRRGVLLKCITKVFRHIWP